MLINSKLIKLAVSVFILVFGLCLATQTYAADSSIVVSDVWAKAVPNAAKTAAVYMTIRNNSTKADSLTSVEAEVSDKAQIHMMMGGSTMEMRDMGDDLSIPAGGTVELAPKGYHIMLIGLTQPLVDGGTFGLTLHFAKAGTIKTLGNVKPIGYTNK